MNRKLGGSTGYSLARYAGYAKDGNLPDCCVLRDKEWNYYNALFVYLFIIKCI